MKSFRLPSGVILSTNNSSIAQQYLKYGAVEVGEVIKVPVKEVETSEEDKKSRKLKK